MVQDLVDLVKEYPGWFMGAIAVLIMGYGIYQGIRNAKLRSRKTKEIVRYTHVAIDQIPEEYRNDIATLIRWRVAVSASHDSLLVDSLVEAQERLPEKYNKIANELTGKLVPWLYKYKPNSVEKILQEYNL